MKVCQGEKCLRILRMGRMSEWEEVGKVAEGGEWNYVEVSVIFSTENVIY